MEYTTHVADRTASITADSFSNRRTWTARILLGIGVLFMIFDGTIKLFMAQPVIDSSKVLGLPLHLAPFVGVIELLCLAVYLIPRTRFFGALLLTGYLGGATAMQFRIEEPLFGYVLFPTYVAILFWGSLYLREPRLRALLAFRQ